jgi:hypothetical protein
MFSSDSFCALERRGVVGLLASKLRNRLSVRFRSAPARSQAFDIGHVKQVLVCVPLCNQTRSKIMCKLLTSAGKYSWRRALLRRIIEQMSVRFGRTKSPPSQTVLFVGPKYSRVRSSNSKCFDFGPICQCVYTHALTRSEVYIVLRIRYFPICNYFNVDVVKITDYEN